VHELHNYTTYGPDNRYTSYAIAKMSDHSIAYAERGNVMTLNLYTGQTNQLTHFTNDRIEWIDYNATNNEFLFCFTDLANSDTESTRYLYRLDPNAKTNNLTSLAKIVAEAFKGQWIYGDTGLAYVGTKDNKNYLAVETEDKSLCTNLFVGGNVMSYGVSPKKDKIYAVASLGHEPLGIWEYDIAGKKLRNVLPGMEHPYTVSQFIAPVEMFVTRNGENIPYFMLPPAGLDPHKKYPVVIDTPINDRCEPGPQFLANAGIFYVSVNRHGLASSDDMTTAFDDILAVYDELIKNPNVDPHRIYIAGECASTAIVSQLVDYNPAMWRGAIMLGPNSFPQIPAEVAAFPSIFVSAGKNDAPSFLTATEEFAQKASSQLVPMRVVYHENAGHIFNSTSLAKERYGAAAKFILTDF
jgi:dipeptidyl aminopeptidase/acylaminoacyl peptidase